MYEKKGLYSNLVRLCNWSFLYDCHYDWWNELWLDILLLKSEQLDQTYTNLDIDIGLNFGLDELLKKKFICQITKTIVILFDKKRQFSKLCLDSVGQRIASRKCAIFFAVSAASNLTLCGGGQLISTILPCKAVQSNILIEWQNYLPLLHGMMAGDGWVEGFPGLLWFHRPELTVN